MKTGFNKLSISILTILGLIGITLLIIPILIHSNNSLMSGIAVVCFFLGWVYYNYVRNARFTDKGSKLFLLYSRKMVNIVNLVLTLLITGVVVFIYFQKGLNFGFLSISGVLIVNSLIWIFFPYRAGTLIMTDNNGIYESEIKYLKWDLISSYQIKPDLMLVTFKLKDKDEKTMAYNKYVDIELLKSELQSKLG